jgi:pectate lyase
MIIPTSSLRRRLALALVSFALLSPRLLAWGNGYSGTITGGDTGATVTVTNSTDLINYAKSANPYTIVVSGTIDLGLNGRVNVASNKTLKGATTSSTIKGTVNLSGVTNVVITKLNITANTGDPAANDGISINNSTKVYVTKCTIYDCTDGNLDIAKGSDYVTVSWCKFYYTRNNGHNFSNLIGSSDTDTGGYHLTFHHNWWSTGCKQRMPADRFGPCHMYNNYWDCAGNDYCTGARNVTQMLSQNNYYDGVKNPLVKTDAAKLKTSGNIFNNCTGTQTVSNDSVFTPPYGYTLDATANVPALVKAGAGNR